MLTTSCPPTLEAFIQEGGKSIGLRRKFEKFFFSRTKTLKNFAKALGFQARSFFSRLNISWYSQLTHCWNWRKGGLRLDLDYPSGPSLIAPREDRTTPFREVGTNPILDAQRVRVPPGVSSSLSDPRLPLDFESLLN